MNPLHPSKDYKLGKKTKRETVMSMKYPAHCKKKFYSFSTNSLRYCILSTFYHQAFKLSSPCVQNKTKH